jgi:multidrug efflux pump subunit AcrA (membrane-fusion protein)
MAIEWMHKQVVAEPAAPIKEETLGRPPELQLRRPNRSRKVGVMVLGTIILALVIWAWSSYGHRFAAATPSAPLVTVERRDFVRSLRLHGIVEATQFYSVMVPSLSGAAMDTLVITKLVPSGTQVKQGGLLVEFDRQAEFKNFLNRQAEFRDFDEQIKKKQAEQAAARAKDESELGQAENAVETARLDILKNEIVSRIDAEKNQQNLEEAEANVKQLRETFELKRQAAQAELRVLEIQRDGAHNAMLYAQTNAEKMVIHSPVDGLSVLNLIWKETRMEEVREGEQVRAGVTIMQVLNPAAMRVRSRVNQVDIPYLQPGQPVQVTLDAYPDLVLPGKVEQISPISVASGFSQRVRSCVVTFSMQGSDPRLMPDLSAAVDVVLERRPNVLVLPREAVTTQNGQSYVMVDANIGVEKRPIKAGLSNDIEVVIESGIDAGVAVRRQGKLD